MSAGGARRAGPGPWGRRAEEAACRFLECQGYRVLARNFRCARGEIDVVAEAGERGRSVIAFVEVKARRGTGFGSPEEAVGPGKRLRLLRAAHDYLERHCHGAGPATGPGLRFDLISVEVEPGKRCRITHLTGAF
ncbi:MAG: YraN family protein [Acetobacteraceae bacterium]|nr:YraN family protein [Acetobacteraceae bacterium]